MIPVEELKQINKMSQWDKLFYTLSACAFLLIHLMVMALPPWRKR